MSTELLLLNDVAGLGKEGDIVKVADGYARNFLLPGKYAEPVTEAARRRLAKLQAEREAVRKETFAAAKKIAAKLKDVSVTIRARTSDGENLYGSVNTAAITATLREQGIEGIADSMIGLDEAIKTLGTFDIPVKVHSEITGTIKVWVVEE